MCSGYLLFKPWKEDAQKFDKVPNDWHCILNAVNLEMIEHPEFLDPPVVAKGWQFMMVTCFLNPNKTERKLKLMSLIALQNPKSAV